MQPTTTTTLHTFNGPLSGTTRVSRYQKGKTNLDFTEARVSDWQWHQLGHMQVCTLLQTDNHASTPTLSFLQAGCPSCRPTNSQLNQNKCVVWTELMYCLKFVHFRLPESGNGHLHFQCNQTISRNHIYSSANTLTDAFC